MADNRWSGRSPAGILVLFVIITALLLIAGCSQKTTGPEVVKTDTGVISGATENGISVYRGIPYAAPPTGELRWRPPAAVQPWSGVRDATTYGSTCPQLVPDDITPDRRP